jgi:hypothetical protein
MLMSGTSIAAAAAGTGSTSPFDWVSHSLSRARMPGRKHYETQIEVELLFPFQLRPCSLTLQVNHPTGCNYPR